MGAFQLESQSENQTEHWRWFRPTLGKKWQVLRPESLN